MPTSVWSLFARQRSNPLQEEKQMMMEQSISASSRAMTDWQLIDWAKVRRDVRRLQFRIAKAIRAGKHGRAKALQWLLTHSRSAKLPAVQRVTGDRKRV